ncbi:hypothetical protein IW146_007729 [Coemansia sp. RSA 922]|nr:hypothetical protein H4S03_006417 [Coemansia sp. S3946]KAJ2045036.1 hypothetical protein H4S04_005879 [Coemansia sp. S16]KAJ2067707.1 hypothetical protein GGI08_001240 [Coemansia sp. S2]KAJ2071374.1 hypothetical protein GGH13_003397 [Coemansia sp. S155-1]KAJ2106564.1 hypothetical protein IW146_007729 [Coemansia sp. RSA 922]KAJ2343525.1 hypothetical protein GGH92_004878 [Coemansia sp. RSA 2673]
MSIPIRKYNPTYVGRTGSKYRNITPSTTHSSSTSHYNSESEIDDKESTYDSWGTVDSTRTFVSDLGRAANADEVSKAEPVPHIMPESYSTLGVSYGQTVKAELAKINQSSQVFNDPPLTKNKRMLLVLLRITHTIVGLMLFACVGGMQTYMLLGDKSIVIVPLFICRIFLMAALVVLALCDWSLPAKILHHFPMYNDRRSWKGLGISQLVVAFFVLGDSTLGGMSASGGESTLARILFPLVLTSSFLMILVGIVYFIAGAVGGVRLKRQLKNIHFAAV